MRTIGDRVREARKSKELSQAGLAKLAGVSQSAICQLERGRGSTTHLVKIALATGYSATWLENETGPKKMSEFEKAVARQDTERLGRALRALDMLEGKDPA